MAKKHGIDYYYLDHAYFNSGYRTPYWMRITKNGFAQNSITTNEDPVRFKNNFNLQFEDYNFKDKKNIVIFPPSHVVTKVFDKYSWEQDIIARLRKFTDKPIVVRNKPGNSICDLLYNPIKVKPKQVYAETLEEVLSDAYCVVAYNTTVALDALRMGIPVICDRFCPAFPLSHSISEIENLKEKERLPLFESLAHGQFTLAEARSPETFKYINSVKQWKGETP